MTRSSTIELSADLPANGAPRALHPHRQSCCPDPLRHVLRMPLKLLRRHQPEASSRTAGRVPFQCPQAAGRRASRPQRSGQAKQRPPRPRPKSQDQAGVASTRPPRGCDTAMRRCPHPSPCVCFRTHPAPFALRPAATASSHLLEEHGD